MPGNSSEPRRPEVEEITVEHGTKENISEALALSRRCSDGPQWPMGAWERLAEGIPESAGSRLLLLARGSHGALCGWLAANIVLDQSELDFLLVHPRHRRSGVAVQLLQRWKDLVRERGAREILLEVRQSNAGALALYRTFGFAEQGRRCNYYRDPREDAILMHCIL